MGSSSPATWTWTPQRRAALRLTLEGLTQAEVARRIGVHRHTLQNWSKAAEWITELRKRVEERTVSARFRRAHSTERLTDKLARLADKALEADRIDVPRTGLLLRELRDYQRLEREHMGLEPACTARASARNLPTTAEPFSISQAPEPESRLSDRPFKELIQQHMSDISEDALRAETPQEALILAVHDILAANPYILTGLHAEDEAEEHARAARKAAETRRR